MIDRTRTEPCGWCIRPWLPSILVCVRMHLGHGRVQSASLLRVDPSGGTPDERCSTAGQGSRALSLCGWMSAARDCTGIAGDGDGAAAAAAAAVAGTMVLASPQQPTDNRLLCEGYLKKIRGFGQNRQR